MSEADTAPAVTQSQGITVSEAAAMLKARSAPVNPVTEAARTLGKAGAEALKARRAEAQPAQESTEGVEGGDVPNDPAKVSEDGIQNEHVTAEDAPPNEATTDTEEEPAAAQTIDLGDGVTVTLDEVRDSFMLKADHTRKTQALSEKAKELEGKFSQKLSDLDKALAALEPIKGQAKTRAQFIDEFGQAEGLDKWDEYVSRVNAAKTLAQRARTKAQEDARAQAEQDCDQYLVEKYNKAWSDPKKYGAAQVAITKQAKELGFTPEQIYALGVIPGALIALDESRQFREMQASKSAVTKVLAEKPKVVKPGSKVSAQAQSQSALQTARSNLQKTNSVADAVAYLKARRAAGG
jgi:hypothetical protein